MEFFNDCTRSQKINNQIFWKIWFKYKIMSMEILSKKKRLMFTFIKITKLCFKGKLFYICSLCISKKSVLIIIISRCVDFNFKLFYYIYYMISRWSVYHYWIFDNLCHIIWLSCSFDFGIMMIARTMIVEIFVSICFLARPHDPSKVFWVYSYKPQIPKAQLLVATWLKQSILGVQV